MSAAEGGVWRDATADDGGTLARVEPARPTKRTVRPWTAEEVAFLRKHYLRRRSAWCAKRLGRSVSSVVQGARKHGLTTKWTSEELITLRAEWGAIGERSLCRKIPGRTWSAIAMKAFEIGLRDPNQGSISIKQAEERTGIRRERLRQILADAGVAVRRRIRTRITNPNAAYRQRVVDAEEVDAAVKAWLLAEGTKLRRMDAAAATGLSPHQMRNAMRMLCAVRPVEGASCPRGGTWTVSREDAEAAAAMYRAARGDR